MYLNYLFPRDSPANCCPSFRLSNAKQKLAFHFCFQIIKTINSFVRAKERKRERERERK